MTLASILASPYRMPSPRSEEDTDRCGPELVTADGRSLPLVSVSLQVDAGGGIARSVLEHVFENRGPDAAVLHVTYKMPLPADGAVSGYEFTIGGRTVLGKVMPHEDARARFAQAIADGRTAAIASQERADIFRQEIGNVPPGETVVARITIDQPLTWLPEGEWELRFPTVIGPRYVGAGDSVEDARAVAIETAAAGSIAARLSLGVTVNDTLAPGRRVESPSHRCVGDRSCELHQRGDKLDRDIVVRWAVAKREIGVSLRVARPARSAAHGRHAYGLLTVVPPDPESVRASARDLTVLLDTSGSMGGKPILHAKKVVAALVGSLGEADRIEIVEFSSSARAWKKEPVFATSLAKADALRWLERLQAGGGTEMYSAIVASLSALRPDAQRQVVLVTDGYVGGEERIVALCHERLPAGCRFHVVGVGAAPNRSIAKALSRAGRGAEVHVGFEDDPERGAASLLARTAAPVLTDVSVEGDAVVEVAPEHVPDVFAGSPLVCALKVRPEGGTLVVRGTFAGAPWQDRLVVGPTDPGTGAPGVVALFAREQVADLETRWSIGRETAEIDRTIERVGTVFQIATRMTSWVAIDDVRSVDPSDPSRRVNQPHELPYGTTMQGFGLGGEGDDLQTTRAGVLSAEGISLLRSMAARSTGAPPPLASSAVHMPAPKPAGSAAPSAPRPLSMAEMARVAPPAPPKRRLRAVLLLLIVLLIVVVIWAILRSGGG